MHSHLRHTPYLCPGPVHISRCYGDQTGSLPHQQQVLQNPGLQGTNYVQILKD